jgi:hypothetical protein
MKNHELNLKNHGKILFLDTDPMEKHARNTNRVFEVKTTCSFFEMKSYFHFFTQWSLKS